MIGIFFGGVWNKTTFGNLLGNIELDATLDENHSWSAEVTQNPVEEGAPVSDHIIEQADKLSLNCFVTDTPLVASDTVSGTVNGVSVGNRTQGVFDLLYDLIKRKELVTVYTKYKVYPDMAISDISVPRAAGVGEAIEFRVEFIHVRKVATQLVDVPKGISPKKTAKANKAIANKTEPKKDAGKQQATDKTSTITETSSVAGRTLDALLKTVKGG